MAKPPPILEKRAVVSSFIFRFPPNRTPCPEVALFQRSDKVRTYQHHLAPISGSISRSDPSPLAAAWRELSEETTLSPSTLSLWRTGKPFSFSDASVGREWTIHPFAFRLLDPDSQEISTDWEHEGWGWYDPRAILETDNESLRGVPRLRDSLRRVWFEGTVDRAATALADGLDRLTNDRESGSRELATIAMQVFREYVARMEMGDNKEESGWWARMRMAAWHLVKNGRESMGPAILNALLVVLAEIEEEVTKHEEADGEKTRSRILDVIDTHVRHRSKAAADRIQEAFATYLQQQFPDPKAREGKLTLLTMSASSTIRDIILEAVAAVEGITRLELRVLESRPGFEGIRMASAIVSQFESRTQSPFPFQLSVQLYTDASAALASREVDLVLLGADQISASKGVCNKVGSLPLVLSARQVNPKVRVVVLSAVDKINGSPEVVSDVVSEDEDPREVVQAWRSAAGGVPKAKAILDDTRAGTVRVQNRYFEWVPLELVDTFVSDEGVMAESELEGRTQALSEKYRRMFDG